MPELSMPGPAPLAGIRVLELANYLAAPICTAMMADMGAEVIKVEPPAGEASRGIRPTGDAAPAFNHGFQQLNRGKRSLTVDLDRPGAGDLLLRIAAEVDVVVTNLMPGRLKRYGIEYATVKGRNPDIIFV